MLDGSHACGKASRKLITLTCKDKVTFVHELMHSLSVRHHGYPNVRTIEVCRREDEFEGLWPDADCSEGPPGRRTDVPVAFPDIVEPKGDGISIAAAAVTAGAVGAAAGAGAVLASRLGKQDQSATDDPETATED